MEIALTSDAVTSNYAKEHFEMVYDTIRGLDIIISKPECSCNAQQCYVTLPSLLGSQLVQSLMSEKISKFYAFSGVQEPDEAIKYPVARLCFSKENNSWYAITDKLDLVKLWSIG